MDYNQVSKQAQAMFLTGSNRKEVMTFLEGSGMTSEKIEEETTKAFRAIKSVRKELVKIKTKDAGRESNASMIWTVVIIAFIFIRIVLRISRM